MQGIPGLLAFGSAVQNDQEGCAGSYTQRDGNPRESVELPGFGLRGERLPLCRRRRAFLATSVGDLPHWRSASTASETPGATRNGLERGTRRSGRNVTLLPRTTRCGAERIADHLSEQRRGQEEPVPFDGLLRTDARVAH